MASPKFEDLEHLRGVITARAKSLNKLAKKSEFKRTGKMRETMRDSACVIFSSEFMDGGRGLIYRRVNKAGTQTALRKMRDLWDAVGNKKFEYKMKHGECYGEEAVAVRRRGAVDFAVVREPLDRWVSGYLYSGRAHPKWGSLVSYARNALLVEMDEHVLPQAFFYAHESRRNEPHVAVLKLENMSEEWPALVSLLMLGEQSYAKVKKAMATAAQVPYMHRNMPNQDRIEAGGHASIKAHNFGGGGPGGGLRFVEGQSEQVQARLRGPLCDVILKHDYELLKDLYPRPAWCEGPRDDSPEPDEPQQEF